MCPKTENRLDSWTPIFLLECEYTTSIYSFYIKNQGVGFFNIYIYNITDIYIYPSGSKSPSENGFMEPKYYTEDVIGHPNHYLIGSMTIDA